MNPFFYLLAILTLGGAVAAMTLRNAVHSALSLVVTFVGLAGVYLALGAQFLGLVQVMVYVGAVAILLVFVLLLTRSGDGEPREGGREGWTWGLTTAGGVVFLLLGALLTGPGLGKREEPPAPPAVKELGEALMTDYVLPLQVVGVLLTVAMIGAAVLALPRDSSGAEGAGEGGGRR